MVSADQFVMRLKRVVAASDGVMLLNLTSNDFLIILISRRTGPDWASSFGLAGNL